MISVIIPAFNAARYLGDAIGSVRAQGHPAIEILVVDDGSSDETAQIAAAFGPPVVCWSRVHGGAAAARNDGVARARGDLIAFLDADDLWAAGKLDRQIAVLEEAPTLEAVFGHVQLFRELPGTKRQLGPVLPGPSAGTMLIRAEALHRVGPYNPQLSLAESLDWYVRAEEAKLRAVVLPEVLLHRRIHDQNVGVTKRDRQTGQYLQVIRAALERKRAGERE